MRRIMSKVATLATVVCLLLSLSVTAHAADVNDGVMGEPIAATVLTAEEKAEQELLAKAIVASAQYLKLSVTEMNLKAGESYAVRVIPTELAQKFGWAIDVDNSKSSNNKYLSVQEVNQETMTITFKAEQSGQRVSLNVRLTNPALVKLAENNPALEQYVKLAQSKDLACKVATNNTGTKVIAGLGITTSAPSVGSSSGGSGNNYPVNPGPSIPVPPPCSDHVDANKDGKCDICGVDMPDAKPDCDHNYVDGVCTECGAKDPNYRPTEPEQPDKPDSHEHVWGEDGKCTVAGCDATKPADPDVPEEPVKPAPVPVEVTVTPETSNGKTTATVGSDEESVNAIKEALQAAADNEDREAGAPLNVTIDVATKGDEKVGETNVTLSADVVAALVEASKIDDEGNASESILVTVNSDTGTVTLPLEAVLAAQGDVAEGAPAPDVELAVADVDKDALAESLKGEDGDTILDSGKNEVDMTNAVVLDVTLKVDGEAANVKDLSDNIQITAKAPEGAQNVKVYFVKTEGDQQVLEPIGDADAVYEVNDKGEVSFGVNHLTTFVVTEATVEPEEPSKPTDPTHDCAKDGHEYVDGVCKWCQAEEPADPDPKPEECDGSGHAALKPGEKCPNCDFVAPAEETKDPCEDGKHNYQDGVCTECGAKDPDYSEPTDPEHDCAKDGHEYVDGVCKWCGDKETTTDPKPDPDTCEHSYGNDGVCTKCGATDPSYQPTDPTPGNPDGGEEGNKCEHNNDPATCPECNKDTDGENTEKPGNPDGTEQPGEGGTSGGGNTEGGDNTGTGGDSGDVSTPEGGDNAGTGGTEGEEGNTGTGNGTNQPGDGDGVKDPPIDNEVKDPFANLDLAA